RRHGERGAQHYIGAQPRALLGGGPADAVHRPGAGHRVPVPVPPRVSAAAPAANGHLRGHRRDPARAQRARAVARLCGQRVSAAVAGQPAAGGQPGDGPVPVHRRAGAGPAHPQAQHPQQPGHQPGRHGAAVRPGCGRQLRAVRAAAGLDGQVPDAVPAHWRGHVHHGVP
ncbi:hypothetical protein IWQ56_006317, partial [Coemansia nantahalensis]